MLLCYKVLVPGSVVEAEYVPVQPVAVGSVRQLVTVVRLVWRVVQVEVGHFPDSTWGKVVEAE